MSVVAIATRGLAGGYDQLQVVHDVDIDVRAGRTTALLGSNGAGKTSLVRLLAGVITRHDGTVTVDGVDCTGDSPARRLRRFSWVPEGRPLFDRYSVVDNLRLAALASRVPRREIRARIDAQFDLFPEIARRHEIPAAMMSGGERQMLALARALVGDPSIIVLDEPSIGLAPVVLGRLHEVVGALRSSGRTLLVCEQNTGWLAGLIDDVIVMAGGRVVASGGAELAEDEAELVRHYLGAGQPGSDTAPKEA